MLRFIIARDTMHQQQWLAVIEELGFAEQRAPLEGRFTGGPSLDGEGEFSIRMAEPHGGQPVLAPPDSRGGAQEEQLADVATLTTIKSRRGAKAR